MNKSLIAVILVAITTLAGLNTISKGNSDMDIFEEWKQKHGQEFDAHENVYRFKIFQQTLKQINEHNAKLDKTHEEALNQFSSLTQEQFKAKYLSEMRSSAPSVSLDDGQVNGATVDWVSYGAVSPVSNQGSCGATYAFSAVGAIEGVSVIFYKSQTVYSVQQVIDCSQAYGNSGCVSGRMDFTFNYVRDKGLNTAAAYPYIAQLGTCQAATGLFKIKGYINITDCTSLANALISRPISVAVDGSNFRSYSTGIFYSCNTNLSLAVLLVGMTDSYWTLKNSWGTGWGEAGYIRIGRGNTCGVCSVGSYPYI